MAKPEISVVIPCLNEEKTMAICIEKSIRAFKIMKVRGEVVVSDNGSTDKSAEIAKKSGARVVFEEKKGYGNAYRKGISEAKGKYIVMGDADNTYDFLEMPKFVALLKEGNEFVIGTRLKGRIMPRAMPPLHRYVGNPFLSWVLNKLFHTKISDAHCGMRAFTKESYEKLNLRTAGMEFASEMIVNAALKKLKIKEVPITYYPREGETKLRSFKDGWRHLRFMLLYSPDYVFSIPGVILFCWGMIIQIAIMVFDVGIGHAKLGPITMLGGAMMSIIGYQIFTFGMFAKNFMIQNKFLKETNLIRTIANHVDLEKGIIAGLLMVLIGMLINARIIIKWISSGYGELGLSEIKYAIFALAIFIFGVQTIFSSFLMSTLRMDFHK